jgi:hypothetical protein
LGELGSASIQCFSEGKRKYREAERMKNGLLSTFQHCGNADKLHLSSSIKTKSSKITFSAETGLSETLLGPG